MRASSMQNNSSSIVSLRWRLTVQVGMRQPAPHVEEKPADDGAANALQKRVRRSCRTHSVSLNRMHVGMPAGNSPFVCWPAGASACWLPGRSQPTSYQHSRQSVQQAYQPPPPLVRVRPSLLENGNARIGVASSLHISPTRRLQGRGKKSRIALTVETQNDGITTATEHAATKSTPTPAKPQHPRFMWPPGPGAAKHSPGIR